VIILFPFPTPVHKEELNKYNHLTGDTEGIVNYGLGIKGIRMAAFFAEREDLIKISFRSQGDFSVREIAAEHFEGGGHKNAAGGKSKASLEETIKKFISLLPLYKDQLTK
jgi:phosphoesterase RecJ-like protein